jgi:serine/threonine protein kinase
MLLGGDLTQTGQLLGTIGYMSPEQLRGTGVDGRSDVFSLGAVLYELVSGVAPFGCDDAWSVALRTLDEAPPPHVFGCIAPDWLRDVILRCLEKKPEDRFSTAAALARSLRAERMVS